MVMAYMIWRAMFGNGVPIGMMKIIIAIWKCLILKDQVQVRAIPVLSVGVLGAAVLTTGVLLAAALVILIIGTTTAVFVVCQDCRTAGPFTLVHA
jgi:hypothetical protein